MVAICQQTAGGFFSNIKLKILMPEKFQAPVGIKGGFPMFQWLLAGYTLHRVNEPRCNLRIRCSMVVLWVLFACHGPVLKAAGASPEKPPLPALPPDMTASVSSSRIGATTGEFRVDESGSATYSIPILTAPASGGVQPQISLDYSSQAASSELGPGWALGGVSTITRCPQTMEQDGRAGSKGIRLDRQDRYCLDGQRLIADLSSGDYGANGTRYRTEIDNFSRIISYGSAGNGPAWFRLERRDGAVIEYGNSQNSRIEARGSETPATVFTWAQNRSKDRYGNYILYRYAENSTGPVGFVLQRVDYTGNVRAGTLPSARLSFIYSDRSTDTDLAYSYVAGMRLEQRRLLQSIRSLGKKQAGSPLEDLRFYKLTYAGDGMGRQVLIAVTECRSVARRICYKPTSFGWLRSEHTVGTAVTALEGLLPKTSVSGLLLADVSGDGRPDLLYTEKKDKKFHLNVKSAKASGGFTEWSTVYDLPKKSDGLAPQVFAIDINADGLQDVVYGKYSSVGDDYTWVARVSNGSKFYAETRLNPEYRFFLNGQGLESRIRVLDFNGDGLSDIMHTRTNIKGSSWYLSVLLNAYTPGGRIGLSSPFSLEVDNSDLFPDLSSDGWEMTRRLPIHKWGIDPSGNKDVPDVRVFDFNGDGAVDLLLKVWREYRRCIKNCAISALPVDDELGPVYQVRRASFWVLMESNGKDAFVRRGVVALGEDCVLPAVCANPAYEDLPVSNNVWPVDINADGLADLAWGDTGNNWYFELNNGRDFEPRHLIGKVPEGVSKLVRFEDWTGDSYPDLIYPAAILTSTAIWMMYQNHFGRAFAAAINTLVPVGNVGGDIGTDPVENDASIFADFNGDGKTDQLQIDNDTEGRIRATRLRKGMNVSGSRVTEPANVITRILGGLGAVTEIEYKPLTDPDVYTRLYNSIAADWGRGAAVYDLVAPIYVVSGVSSSSPTFGVPSARRRAEYHYVGARLQAGGRGALGFAEIIAYDPQLRIHTNTRYRQDFPFTGLPVDTARISWSAGPKFFPLSKVASRAPAAWAPVTGNTKPPSSIAGTLLSYSIKQWKATATIAGAWNIQTDTSLQRDYTLSGQLASKVLTRNTHDAVGNLKRSIVRTFAQDGGGYFAKRTTRNIWSTADLSSWYLGQLRSSKISHERAGLALVSRRSAYAYDTVTGAMVKEVTEPSNTVLRVVTIFSLDRFGNRIQVSKRSAGMKIRNSAVAYDVLGRFATHETNSLRQVTSRIDPKNRDVFGNPLEIENIDGVVTSSAVDLMGRPFASYDPTGAWQKSLNYTGAGSECPAGTAWHSISTNGGGALGQQCFDVIGRKVRSVTNSISNRRIYTDLYYDLSGRPGRASEPYFKNETRFWNETVYDVAGRITGLLSAGGDNMSTDYDEKALNQCTPAGPRVTVNTNALGQQVTEVKNVLGETTEVYDDNCGQVVYRYDAIGNLTSVKGADGSVVGMSYDGGDRKIAQDDPDKGHLQYAYNALGELTRQLDARNQAIDFEYDPLGRVTHRRELKAVDDLSDTVYTTVNHQANSYRTGRPGMSQPSATIYRIGESGAIVHRRKNDYDWFGRVNEVINTLGSLKFSEFTTYDEYGRIFQRFDASGDDHGLRHVYRYGHLSQLKEAREGVDGIVYQSVLDMDARGNVTLAELGNGVQVVADYDPASGRLKDLSAYEALGVELQDVRYLFDVLGNLKTRHDTSGISNLREGFSYDSLNRLSRVRLTAPSLGISSPVRTLAVNYDASGNITWKSGVGIYGYGAGRAGPHAVTRAGGASYSYDANGNQLTGNGRSIRYTVFDKADNLKYGDTSVNFTYGADNNRLKREDSAAGNVNKTTVYIGTVEYVTELGGSTYFKRHLGGTAIATYYPETLIQQVSYLVKDHIGSIHSVLDEQGRITARMHFSPFGERQDSDWRTPLDSFLYAPLNAITTRGFTGHEQVDSVGVIHMNGRIYDAKLGRFLQADPFVQNPKNSQSLNRYSYVLNNPLSHIDPTGYFSIGKFFKKYWRVIVAAVASYFTYGIASGWASGWLAGTTLAGNTVAIGGTAGGIAGFVGGALISGSIKGAVKGAFSGAVFGGVAGYFGSTYSINRVAADSIAGGISAEIYGQKFKDGLLFGALVSSVTYIAVRLRTYQMAKSDQFPGQIGESEGFRGIEGKLAGERTFEETWVRSGAAKDFADGKPLDWIIENKYIPFRKRLSPLGGIQGGEGLLFGKSYRSGGFIDYLLEGYSGVHDTFNQPFFYKVNGTNRLITSIWQKSLGYVINPLNVVLASPIVLPALVPDYMRYFYFQDPGQ